MEDRVPVVARQLEPVRADIKAGVHPPDRDRYPLQEAVHALERLHVADRGVDAGGGQELVPGYLRVHLRLRIDGLAVEVVCDAVRNHDLVSVHILDNGLERGVQPVRQRAVVREVVPGPDHARVLRHLRARLLVRDHNRVSSGIVIVSMFVTAFMYVGGRYDGVEHEFDRGHAPDVEPYRSADHVHKQGRHLVYDLGDARQHRHGQAYEYRLDYHLELDRQCVQDPYLDRARVHL